MQIDEGYVVGPREHVFNCLQVFVKDLLETYGLVCRPDKFAAYFTADEFVNKHRPRNIPEAGVEIDGVFHRGLVVAGIPIGSTKYVQHKLEKIVRRRVSNNNKITSMLRDRSPKSLFIALYYCCNGATNHLFRGSKPSDIQEWLCELQASVDGMLAGALGTNVIFQQGLNRRNSGRGFASPRVAWA
jgi:hypothetical protein